jgi:signal transduction histidine kinase
VSTLDAVVNALPEWMRSARFRITILYSTILFLLAAALVGALYFSLLASLSDEPVSAQLRPILQPTGVELGEVLSAQEFEQRVNKHTLENLRMFSFGALGVLFVVSLGVGWVISGRVLAPIDRITDVANRIQATDLSRRIRLEGPDDELKRLADTFDGMLARLDAAFAMQRRFIADASHELRNPLATIRTNLDVDLADPDAGRDRLRHSALVVRRATERMSRLVDDLLALARLDAPNALIEHVDLSVVVEDVVDEFAAVAREQSVRLEPSVGEPAQVLGDTQALRRAAANLVENAILFSPEGGRVTIGTGRHDEWAWIAVEDEGPGIALDQQARVFERFWRADESRSRDNGGSGLGLAIVRQIVDMHLGEVNLLSKPGRGSTFVLWLPASDAASSARSEPPAASPLRDRVASA